MDTYKLKSPDSSKDLALLLIGEELKSHKFFSTLRTLGLDDAFYQTDLSSFILASVNLNDESNETLDFYFALLEKHSQCITTTKASVIKAATAFHADLMSEQKRRTKIR